MALNPENGEMVWYYQQVPGETFDFTSTQPIILADLEIDGKMRMVLLQAPKNGFFTVIDRTNGALISAEPFVYVNWASGIDEESGSLSAGLAQLRTSILWTMAEPGIPGWHTVYQRCGRLGRCRWPFRNGHDRSGQSGYCLYFCAWKK